MAFCIWKFNYFISESTIDKKLEEFQKALYRHQITTPDIKIYDPHDMQKFTDKNSPELFQDILTCITGGKILTEKRRQLQEQRAVALLHIFAYFRCVLWIKWFVKLLCTQSFMTSIITM